MSLIDISSTEDPEKLPKRPPPPPPRRNSAPLPTNPLDRLVETELLREAGLDFESRPMLLFFSCALPDPKQFDYDLLLESIMKRLDGFVENDYSVVFFNGAMKHKPGASFLIKAYRRFTRKYKKNLKALWIVHPSSFTKFALQILSKIISPKVAKKIVLVNTLSELTNLVPYHQLQIPDAIYRHNMDFESSVVFPSLKTASEGSKVFGVPLEELMGIDGSRGMPRVIVECTDYVTLNGLDTEGLFRRSPASHSLQSAKDAYNRDLDNIDLGRLGGVHLAASLIKNFLREIPVAPFGVETYEVMDDIVSVSGSRTDELAKNIREVLIPLLPVPSQMLIAYVFRLLKKVKNHSEKNLMTSSNLAIVITPNLARSTNPVKDLQMCTGNGSASVIVKTCIDKCDAIFGGEVDTTKEGIKEGNSRKPTPGINTLAQQFSRTNLMSSPITPQKITDESLI